MNNDLNKLTRRILKDIKVELQDEFDKNFERQGFFSHKWPARTSPFRRGGHLLVDSGDLRRSVTSRSDDKSVTFYSLQPYAGIHNEGGEIKVTERMKRFFRAKFYEAQGGFVRKGGGPHRPLTDGGFAAWTSKMHLSPEAAYWRALALKKVGSTVKIPRRQFLGMAPEVEAQVRNIIEDELEQYFGREMRI